MWYLTSENDERVIYVVSQQQSITIGRSVDNQVCDFAIPDDPSISRKHVTLSVTDNSLYLQDLGSRYGTFINGSADKVRENTNILLSDNDVVKFGKMNSKWTVHNANLNTCTSTLKGESLQKLKLTLSKVGGVLKNEWDDSCNYLTMPAITLTIKVVLALVQGSHIVTTEYWTKLVESVENFTSMPEPQKYIPSIMESTLNKEVVSFLPDQRRQSIFKNKKFIFFARRQFEMYKPVLIRSGASPLLLAECKMTVSMLCEPNVIVIQYIATGATQETGSQRNQINDIVNHLKNKGKRVIADAEIGLAILYCSTEKYCNPSFSFTSQVVNQNSGTLTKNSSKILAPESQEPIKSEKENVKINETYESDDKNNLDLSIDKQFAKRKLSEFTSEVQGNPNKKVATTCFTANIPSESTKRRLSDQSSSSPAKKVALDKENNEQEINSSDKSDEMFNFINPDSNNIGETKSNKKLNLTKPQKRKLDASAEDGNLFNFVQADEGHDQMESSKQSIFSANKVSRGDDSDAPKVKYNISVTPEDISAMRGVKLKELISSISNDTSNLQDVIVKQEKNEHLAEKMSSLNISNTIVITCNNLIVKKEPFKIETSESPSSVKNFKKFKKVWPVKKQVTIISTLSMNIANLTDSNSYSVAF